MPNVRSLGLQPSVSASNPEVYFSAVRPPNEQRVGSMTIAIRSTGDPMAIVPGLRRVLADLDPDLAIYDMATVRQRLSEALAESRLYGTGSGVFAGAALFLAVIGLYGVMAYSVSSRTQEWGIRMALGASASGIVRHVLRDGITLAAIGIPIGMAGAWAASRSLRNLLFGVTPSDPTTLIAVAGLFMVVAGIACYLPARLASRVDPMVALRHK